MKISVEDRKFMLAVFGFGALAGGFGFAGALIAIGVLSGAVH